VSASLTFLSRTLADFYSHPGALMWLHDNWSTPKSTKRTLGIAWSIFVLVIGTFLLVAGTYGSIVGIIDEYAAAGGSAAWSCADNSNSKAAG
jgi:hypothetical protein